MIMINILEICFYIFINFQQIVNLQEISYNTPKLPNCPKWNPNGIIFVNETIIGQNPLDVFIDRNNLIYLVNEYNEEIQIWNKDNILQKIIILYRSIEPWGLFVTNDGNIYIGSDLENGQVTKWTQNETKGIIVMNSSGACPGLFVDILNNIYCSMGNKHQVLKQSLIDNLTSPIIVAGNGTKGSNDNMLNGPRGIFVTIKFDLYVADCWNNRIQFFKFGHLNGLTLTESIHLACPTNIFLDNDDYLFIVDNGNHRIIGSGSNGFYCIIGCSNSYGSTSIHLHYPYAAYFDYYGNIFVADQNNHRIQKFILIKNNSNNPSSIQSKYSSKLTETSQIYESIDCEQSNYYYEILEIEVLENGCYHFLSNSTIDIYLYMNEDYFKPITLNENLYLKIVRDHIYGQFQLEVSLLINKKYILAITTFESNTTGIFSIIATGPNIVKFKRINVSWEIQEIYSSELSFHSELYTRTGCGLSNYYYQAIEINIIEPGYYIIVSNNTIDTYGFIYENNFDVFNSKTNLILDNDRNNCNYKFKISILLQINIKYILVVTTSYPNTTGLFSIIIFGPNNVNINHISNISSVIQSTYSSALTEHSQKYGREGCKSSNFYYEALQINVKSSGLYIISSSSDFNTYGYLYKDYFNPLNRYENLLNWNDQSCPNDQFKIVFHLQSTITYVLVVTAYFSETTGEFLIFTSGPNKVTFTPISIQTIYESILTKDTPTYSRVCGRTNYHYETIEVNVEENNTYIFNSNYNNNIIIYGYIYKDNFDPFNSTNNLLKQSNYSCGGYDFQFSIYLQMNITYILVITTFQPNIRGEFSVFVYGSNNVTLNRIINNYDSCVIGDPCNSYMKGIGLTLDDILRNEIQQNVTLINQSFLVTMSAVLIMIMFIGGLINSILSIVTFQNVELRKVGCGMYLLSSSITSLLTIVILIIEYWFVVLTQINVSINLSFFRYGCMSIESLLKVFIFLSNWLNACVAIERAISVSKGVIFNQNKSKRFARWIIFILPIVVITTIIHEPIHRDLLEYTTEKYTLKESNYSINNSMEYEIKNNETDMYQRENHVLCVVNYSRFVQDYNTVILFFHLIVPFIANLLSALYIIFGTARQRSTTRTKRTYKEHILKQLKEHKQLVISPIILLILSLPRLIISLVSECVDASINPWLYLSGYFISFTPSMLIFFVFVFPSELYMKKFKETLHKWHRQTL